MPRLLSREGALRLFGSAVVAQVVLSAGNFAVGLLLIRYTEDVTYGRFVLVQAAVLLLMGLQRAWVVDPVTVIAPQKSETEQRHMIGAIKTSQRRFFSRLSLFAATVPLAGYWLGWVGAEVGALVAAAVLAVWAALEREYLRAMLMIFKRPEAVLVSDLFYVAALIAGVLLVITLPTLVAVWVTLALCAAAWLGRVSANRSLARDPGWQDGSAAAYWRELRPLGQWAVVGASVYWLFGQGYNYILALKLDATAVAHVNAIRLLLMPAFLLTVGIKGLLLPMAVRWLGESGYDYLLKQLTSFILALGALSCVYYVLLWFTADWVLANVLQKEIPNYRLMLVLWSLLSLINLVRDLYLSALLVRRRFKLTARLVAVAAAVTLSVMWIMLDHFGAAGALVGLAIGELVFLAGVVWLVLRERKLSLPGEGQALETL